MFDFCHCSLLNVAERRQLRRALVLYMDCEIMTCNKVSSTLTANDIRESYVIISFYSRAINMHHLMLYISCCFLVIIRLKDCKQYDSIKYCIQSSTNQLRAQLAHLALIAMLSCICTNHAAHA